MSLVDVFNHSFWKLYIKTINDLDPGLNLPELATNMSHPPRWAVKNQGATIGLRNVYVSPFSAKRRKMA